ncbi:MAG: cell division protein FtsI [Actinophytocola sp.]|nr:cell division protein FtsI [Actinophytocola sp.]
MAASRRERGGPPRRGTPARARPRASTSHTGASRTPVRSKRVAPRRGRRVRIRLRLPSNRYATATLILVTVLSLAGLKLVYLQAFQAEALSARAEEQRETIIDLPAKRGDIIDRNGTKLAFSVETRTLQVNLRDMRERWNEHAREHPESGKDFEARIAEISAYMAQKLPALTTEDDLLSRFRTPGPFTFLVDNVPPSVADTITRKFPEIAQEKRAMREYPGGRLASNIVGYANWRMDSPDRSKHNIHGLVGLENAYDNALVGRPGRVLVDTSEGDDIPIPGTAREVHPAVPGSDLELTIDSDVQYELQRRLSDYVSATRANGGSAVVMDAKTGEVYGLANDTTFDPDNITSATAKEMNNQAVTTPFEPGSVNKVVTASAALEHGVVTPRSRIMVPGQITVADRTIRDAWAHGTMPFTTTGVFAKSSNVGTLKLAQRVGEGRWLGIAKKFGLGERTGIGLPGESPGSVPPRNQWSGSTFGNLPIGQGLSMTVVQLAGMYQAIANGGERVEPRIVSATVRGDGTRVPRPAPDRVQVVSEHTADQVLRMLRATTQDAPGYLNDGTAPPAAVEGYQIAAKTGTAQQIDPVTGAYSQSKYNITFAGVLPADNPRFVVAIRLDAPDTTLPLGYSAAPLYHDIAAYLAQRYQIPLSEKRASVMPLVLD